MLIMLSYEMLLKNKLIEGNYQEELYKSLDNLDYNRPTLELPLDKMTLIMEKILEKITGDGGFKKGKECKGEFVINKLTNKTCGDGFNERVYKILDRGDGDCLHSELYKEKLPLKPCEYAEKCEKDLDCKSNKCNDGFCDFKLDCSETMLSGCDYDSCLALNDGLDKDLYYWKDNKCNVNPCNENTYQMCDEGGCNDLSYRFKYDTEKKQCKEIINKQGESNTEPTSMAKIYQEYVDQGGYESVCKDVDSDKETCEVGADLQPRYYCKEGYVKGNDGIDGDSNHCISCQYPDEVTDPSAINNACLEESGNTQQQIQDYCNSSPGDVNILVNDIRNNSNCSPKSISYNCVTGGWCDDSIDDSSDSGLDQQETRVPVVGCGDNPCTNPIRKPDPYDLLRYNLPGHGRYECTEIPTTPPGMNTYIDDTNFGIIGRINCPSCSVITEQGFIHDNQHDWRDYCNKCCVEGTAASGGSEHTSSSDHVPPGAPCGGIIRDEYNYQYFIISGTLCTNPTPVPVDSGTRYKTFSETDSSDSLTPCTEGIHDDLQCGDCTRGGSGVNTAVGSPRDFCSSCCVEGTASGGGGGAVSVTQTPCSNSERCPGAVKKPEANDPFVVRLGDAVQTGYNCASSVSDANCRTYCDSADFNSAYGEMCSKCCIEGPSR